MCDCNDTYKSKSSSESDHDCVDCRKCHRKHLVERLDGRINTREK